MDNFVDNLHPKNKKSHQSLLIFIQLSLVWLKATCKAQGYKHGLTALVRIYYISLLTTTSLSEA